MSDACVTFPYDLYHFWAAGTVARSGGNPYDVTAIQPLMVGAGWPPEENVFGFLHPFWSLWIFSILSLAPFPIVKLLWEALLMILCGTSVYLLMRPAVRRLLTMDTPAPFLVFGALLFPPVMSNLSNAQTNPFMLLGVVGWLVLSLEKRYMVAGAVLSLTTIKPQLFIPFYLWVFLSHLKRREDRLAIGFAVGFLLQAGLSLILAPQAAAYWIASMQQVSHAAMNLPTAALSRILSQATGFEQMPLVLMGTAIVVASVLALRSKGDPILPAILVWVPLSLLVAPYTWAHSFLVLLPPYFALLSKAQCSWLRGATYGVFALAVFGVFEMLRPHALAQYMALLPIILLLFGVRQMRFPFTHSNVNLSLRRSP